MFSGLAGGSTSHSQLPAPTGKSLAGNALCIAVQRPATSPFCDPADLLGISGKTGSVSRSRPHSYVAGGAMKVRAKPGTNDIKARRHGLNDWHVCTVLRDASWARFPAFRAMQLLSPVFDHLVSNRNCGNSTTVYGTQLKHVLRRNSITFMVRWPPPGPSEHAGHGGTREPGALPLLTLREPTPCPTLDGRTAVPRPLIEVPQ